MNRPSLDRTTRRVSATALTSLLTCLVLATACTESGPSEGAEAIPAEAPDRRGGEALLDRAEIIEVLDLQNRRDGAGLRSLLEHEDAAVRARAAFALASVQDADAVPPLQALLADPAESVRRDAAFALGQIPQDDGGGALLEALQGEEVPEVRLQLLESLGLQGGEAVVTPLVDWSPGAEEAGAYYLALARMGLRAEGSPPEVLLERLLEGLTEGDDRGREAAAYYFGRLPESEPWAARAERLRDALDGYEPADPAAMHLLLAVGRLRDRDDADRFRHWMAEAEDWRIRVNAVRAVGTTQLLETPGIREALWERVENDPYEHVGMAAAISLLSGFRVPNATLERALWWIDTGPDRWPAKLPFLEFLGTLGEAETVVEWIDRHQGTSNALDRVLPGILSATAIEDPIRRVRPFADHDDLHVRVAALAILAERWEFGNPPPEVQEEYYDLFVRVLREGHRFEAVKGAEGLSDPSFHPYGAVAELEAAYRDRIDGASEDDVPVLVAILGSLARIGDPVSLELIEEALEDEDFRLRRAAGEAVGTLTGRAVPGLEIPDPQTELDPEYLIELGANPRLVLETDRGTLRILLAPEEAPLTVQTIARYAEAGRYDGVLFHRVIGNFVTQGGDFTHGDGGGGPGVAIRSELTRIPFRRGVIGMASSGRDTEESQFFLTHSMQPHLDGSVGADGAWQAYTAFGWLEEGESVLDRLMEGDRILEARVERDRGSEPGSGSGEET